MKGSDISGTISVLVDDEVWTATNDLASAGSEDKVFAVDSAGTVTFGDGKHGRQPDPGAQVTVSWRQGGGEEGNTQLTLSTSWPPPNARYQISASSNEIRFNPVFGCLERSFGEKRVRYFAGQFLSAEDFQTEQQYFREKLRRHNKFLHGQGVVTGLEVTVSNNSTPPCVIVSPGYAISPEGEELILTQAAQLEIDVQRSPQYVTLQYAQCETDPVATAGSDATPSRIEDRVLVCLIPEEETSGALTLGRVVIGDSGWAIDRMFQIPFTRCR